MARRISINLKEDLYLKLREKSRQSGYTTSKLIRTWLLESKDVKEISIYRAGTSSNNYKNYNFFLDERTIDHIEQASKELSLPRSTFINYIIQTNIDDHKNETHVGDNDTITPETLRHDFGESSQWLNGISPNLNLKETVRKVLSSHPFLGPKISGGIFVKDGEMLKFIDVADYYYIGGMEHLIPIPYTMIKLRLFDEKHSKNIAVKAFKTKSLHMTEHVRDFAYPLLIPAVWDAIQKFMGGKFFVSFPLIYKNQACGVLGMSFHTSKLDLRIMKQFDIYIEQLGELIGRKLENERNTETE